MRKIKLNENIGFTKCRTDSGYQCCSYCGHKIGKGKIALSIIKRCSTGLNVWIHIGCIDKFAKDLIKFNADSSKKLLVEQL